MISSEVGWVKLSPNIIYIYPFFIILIYAAEVLHLSGEEVAKLRAFMKDAKSKDGYRRAKAFLYKAEGLSYRL